VQLPPGSSPEQIVGWIQRAHPLGCKGVAFCRSEHSVEAPCIECSAVGARLTR